MNIRQYRVIVINIIITCLLLFTLDNSVFAGCTARGKCCPGLRCGSCSCVDFSGYICRACDYCEDDYCCGTYFDCDPGDTPPGCPCSGCFTPDTPIDTPNGENQIKDLEVGDEVKSFDEQTREEQTSLVEKIYETTRSAYYKLVLQDGTEVKVTGEHPLYAVPQSQEDLSFWEYLKTKGLVKKSLDSIIKFLNPN